MPLSKNMRVEFAHICFALSSLFRGLGKRALSSDKTIIVDSLTLPGWFVLHEHLIRERPIATKIIGFEWETWPMPDEWCQDLERAKK